MMETGGQKYYYACNALYSVTALTDAAGNVVERYKYEPYGAVKVLNADGIVKTTGFVGNPYTFTGQWLDGETGLMYYKNRYYDTDLGRFVGRDPVFTIGWQGSPRTTSSFVSYGEVFEVYPWQDAYQYVHGNPGPGTPRRAL